MRRHSFLATLESPVVMSSHGGTAGGHSTLPYLPGAVFAGALARELYRPRGEAKEATYTLFHSGKVRVLPAHPMAGGSVALPTPRSLHTEKSTPDDAIWSTRAPHALVAPSALRNLSAVAPEARPLQPRSLDTAYLGRDGRKVPVATDVILKTATDGGVARDAHLFAYQALAAGQRFGFSVEIDADVDAEVDKRIRDVLLAGAIGVGRSRSAEFGRVRIDAHDPGFEPPPPAPSGAGGRVVLYCCSDLALLDPLTLQPTLRPRPEHFGLTPVDGWRFDPDRSFLDTRRYSPFNGARKRPDPERQVIAQGSVIVFTNNHGVETDLDAIRKAVARGIGAYREVGLGQVWLQPAFLVDADPRWEPASDAVLANGATASAAAAVVAPSDPVVAWLEDRQARRERDIAAATLARDWSAELIKHIPATGGVTRTQWGVVRQAAVQASEASKLFEMLFGVPVAAWNEKNECGGTHAGAAEGEGPAASGASGDARHQGLLCGGVRGRKWSRQVRGKSARVALADTMKRELAPRAGSRAQDERDAIVLRAVRLLTLHMPRLMAEKEVGDAR